MTDTLLIIGAGSAVMVLLVAGYITTVLYSHRRVIEAQQARIAEVEASERRYRDLFEHSLAGMLKFSVEDWTVGAVNTSLKEILGLPDESGVTNWLKNLPAPVFQRIKDGLWQDGIVEGCEIHTTRGDGSSLWLLFSARAIEQGNHAHAVVIDITKRKASQETIDEQAAVLNEVQDAVIVVDGRASISYWNKGATVTYGWKPEEVWGKPIGDVLFHSDKLDQLANAMEDVEQYHEWSGEQVHLTKERKEILVLGRWKMVTHESTGRRVLLMVNSDVTEQKQMEAQLIRAERMESIAILTSGIAHDLQNILAPVAISVGLLKEKLSDAKDLSILQAVKESAQSGMDLVRNILTYGHGVVGDKAMLDLGAVLDQVLMSIRPGLPSGVELVRIAGEPCWPVMGDVNQLKQVILNMLVNARDAMPEGGLLRVSLENHLVGSESENGLTSVREGPHIVLAIEDTGIGIPEDEQDKIFEPFYSTKAGTEGTGLGLSISHGIVRSHGGSISVNSSVGHGTTFRIFLPAALEDHPKSDDQPHANERKN